MEQETWTFLRKINFRHFLTLTWARANLTTCKFIMIHGIVMACHTTHGLTSSYINSVGGLDTRPSSLYYVSQIEPEVFLT